MSRPAETPRRIRPSLPVRATTPAVFTAAPDAGARSRIELTVFGQQLVLRDAPADVERWIRYCWQSDDAVAPRDDSLIQIEFHARPPWRVVPAHEAVQTSRLDGASLDWLRHSDRWWSTGQIDAGVELRLLRRHARIRVWGVGMSDTVALALHVALCEALRARGFVPLHAAVVARDGTATALVGRSGVGKSTTMLSLVERGWLPLSEDFAWFDPSTRRVYGWAGERGVRLTSEGLRRVPTHWQLASWRRQQDGKFYLGYDGLAVERPASAELARVLVLHRDPALRSGVEPIPMRDAARALWESAGIPLCRFTRDDFASRIPGLLSRLEWARLVLGRGALEL